MAAVIIVKNYLSDWFIIATTIITKAIIIAAIPNMVAIIAITIIVIVVEVVMTIMSLNP